MDIVKQTTKIVLAHELVEQGVIKTHIAEQIGIGRATLYRWLNGIQQAEGLESFIDQYLTAKKRPRKKRKIDGLVKVWVWSLRKKHRDCCGQKIQYYLEKEKGLHLAVPTIYRILSEKYTLRTKWKKNQKRGPVPKASKPREVVQMDTVDFGEIFAFNGIDIFTKEVDVVLRPSLTSHDGYIFLKTSMKRRFDGRVDLAQTDGGPEFKDEFKQHVLEYANRHRIARPYKKNEQAYIESFNRSLRKECLGWSKYKVKDLPTLTKEVEEYLKYYHTQRAHCSLDMKTPFEFKRLSHI
ncbi:IS481 family transposase [Candidatus Microgenomates bacterium]|nr:IS481 family transposase [Candidatus Microgenomates bacterium]